MSILIKGMEMPESCYYCPFASGSWGQGLEKWCDVLGRQIPDNGTLMNWCPLVEVPTPHGRLINAEPSADRKGKWIDTGSGQECSECHEIQPGYDNFRNYCANCGAMMVRE